VVLLFIYLFLFGGRTASELGEYETTLGW
jgi:hypothetical protein